MFPTTHSSEYYEIESEWYEFTKSMPTGRDWYTLSSEEKLVWLTRNFVRAIERAIELNNGQLDGEKFQTYLGSSEAGESWLNALPLKVALMVQNAKTAHLNSRLL